MKLNTKIQKVTRSGVKSESQFKINATAKAFKILSDGLYSDKVKAIIRELSCNAYDSHIEAGKPNEPFIVKLPSQLEPEFYVEDFGVGLSHDEVINVFTTFFESTKTDSNDYIGALGLGSKSPFSYVDTYSIEAIQGGSKRLYSAFRNEAGVPTISLLHEEVSPIGKAGLKISFPVATSDISEFYDKARDVLSRFSVKPTIKGKSGFKFFEYDYTFDGKHCKIINVARNHSFNISMSNTGTWKAQSCTAIQGNVAYPIDFEIMPQDMKAKYHSLDNNAVEIYFDIGEIEVSPSREALSYDKLTLKAIQAKFDLALNEIRRDTAKKFSGFKTLWEAKLYFRDLGRNSIIPKICGSVMYKGNEVNNDDIFLETGQLVTKVNNHNESLSKMRSFKSHYSSIRASKGTVEGWRIPVSKDIQFMFNDVKGAFTARAASAREQGKELYLITGDIKDYKAIHKLIGNAPMPLLSGTKVVKGSRSTYQAGTYGVGWGADFSMLVFNTNASTVKPKVNWGNSQGGIPASLWEIDKYYTTSGGKVTKWLYVPLTGKEIKAGYFDGLNTTLRGLYDAAASLSMINGDSIRVIGVREKFLDDIPKTAKWVDFSTYIKAQTEKYIRTHKIRDKFETLGLTPCSVDNNNMLEKFDYSFKAIKSPNSPMLVSLAINRHRDAEQQSNIAKTIKTNIERPIKLLAEAYGISLTLKTQNQKVEPNLNVIYPLLSNLSYGIITPVFIKEVIEYINFKDSLNNNVTKSTSTKGKN